MREGQNELAGSRKPALRSLGKGARNTGEAVEVRELDEALDDLKPSPPTREILGACKWGCL